MMSKMARRSSRCSTRSPAPLASFIGDGAYDQSGIYSTVAERHPEAEVIIPPRSTAVLSEMAETAPTQRDRHLQSIAEHGRMGWQKRSGYTRRALVETAISRLKRVIGDALALANGSASRDRSRHRHSCPEPHA